METELVTWDHKLQDLNQQGELMAKQGHFDAPNILKAIKAESVRAMQATQTEAPGIPGPAGVHRRVGSGAAMGAGTLVSGFLAGAGTEPWWSCRGLCKKHQKLRREVEGHQAQVSKTLATAVEYGLTALREELDQSWQQLQKLVADRQARLDLALKAQLFFNEALEIENWMNEKMDVLTSTDYGRDEDAAIKMLTKHKALELEIDTYSGLITEITHQAQKMIDSDHPDSKVISNRMQVIQQQIKNMNKLANIKRGKLLEAKLKLEYFRESRGT
ncbi:SPTBN5 [Cordylochernes scorpioides]|uniref:SPTBN5 n=1 Tax=Cordylochernes scorpioides TaxID=51811 RepID=A0ABY6K1L0_9ARAC|nr:SPTBN5 [Cordylochernes scorpioides]